MRSRIHFVRSKKRKYKTLTAEQKEQRKEDRRFRDRMMADFYRLAGLNTKGEPLKTGWDSGAGGLTSLSTNPILDPYYEAPEAPDRLTKDDLRWLL